MSHSIIFFDSHCPLCCRTINFLARQDKKKHFRFASLDGTTAKKMVQANLRDLNTVILLERPKGRLQIQGSSIFGIILADFTSFCEGLYRKLILPLAKGCKIGSKEPENRTNLNLKTSPSGKIWLRGRAVFRVLWLLGGKWKLLGWLYIMPFVDLFYKFIAKHRKRSGDLPPLDVHLLP